METQDAKQISQSTNELEDGLENSQKIPPFDPWIEEEEDKNGRFISLKSSKSNEDSEEEITDSTLELPSPFQLHAEISAKVHSNTQASSKTTAEIKPGQVISSVQEIIQRSVSAIEMTRVEGKTEMTFHYESKTFDSVEIHIDHYDTSPHSFNIEIRGNEMLQKQVLERQMQLEVQLAEKLPHHRCHVLPPVFKAFTKKREKAIVKTEQLRYHADQKEETNYGE